MYHRAEYLAAKEGNSPGVCHTKCVANQQNLVYHEQMLNVANKHVQMVQWIEGRWNIPKYF